jgi:hypothetical protein
MAACASDAERPADEPLPVARIARGTQPSRRGRAGRGSHRRDSDRRAAERADRWELGVSTTRGRLGIRQFLEPHRERAHLGAEVTLRRSGSAALVDWPATLARAGSAAAGCRQSVDGWKALSDPPPPGIADPRSIARRLADAVPATLASADRLSSGMGMATKWDLELGLGDRNVSLRGVRVPAYAVHLLVPGATLPATADAIDWPQAAEDAAGAPVAFDFDSILGVPEESD